MKFMGVLFMRTFFRAGVLFALSWFLWFPAVTFAQQNVSVGQGYNNILQQGIIFANICQSPAPVDGSAGDTCQCRAQGICSLAELTQVAINIIILILGISGTIALGMFVWGGWNFIFAQGRGQYIETGKRAMKNAIMGLAIVFGAYSIVNFTVALLKGITPSDTLEGTIQAPPANDGTPTGSGATIDADSVLQTTSP